LTLLNGLLAFGALAFTVPLAIHLLFRNRFQVMEWGAMHLLEAVVRVNRRRLQLMHLLLLLLRCLIPIVLAFCLARPVLTGFQVLPGDAPRTLVIALDDSQSMSARDSSGQTRMERAKQSIEVLLGTLSRRDEVMLMRSSQLSLPVSASSAQDAAESLRKVKAASGPVDLGNLLRAAIEAAEDGVYPQRQIVVVGDFSSDSLDDASMETLSAVAESIERKSLKPSIGFLNLGKESGQLANLSVDSIESNSAAVIAGRGGSFQATVRNASDLPVRDLRLTWYLDGSEVGQASLTVAARSSTVARLTHRIDQVGVHLLTVSVEHADVLLEDNQRSIAVDVIDEIKVLLVDGDPAQEPLEGETDYLAIALSPFAFGGEDQPDAVQTKVCLRQQLQKSVVDDAPDLVVLANVSDLSDQERSDLSQFVMRGGTLVIFDGDQVDPADYNADWTCAEGSWKLPALLGEVIGETEGENRLQQPSGSHHAIYSPWESLRTGNEQPFADIDIFAYRDLKVSRSSTESPAVASLNVQSQQSTDESVDGAAVSVREFVGEDEDSQVGAGMTLWSLGNGAPVAVLARRGDGNVVQFSIPCDTAWASLPLRLVFLPMMQQLVLDTAGNQQRVNIAVGESVVVAAESLIPTESDLQSAGIQATDEKAAASVAQGNGSQTTPNQGPVLIDEAKAVKYRIQGPDGGEESVEPSGVEGGIPRLILPSAMQRGVYQFHAETPIVGGLPAHTETIRLASIPASESVLRDADPERVRSAAELSGAMVYEEVSALASDDQQRRFGREIWRWLFAALLVLLVGELLLQQRAVATVTSTRSKVEAI